MKRDDIFPCRVNCFSRSLPLDFHRDRVATDSREDKSNGKYYFSFFPKLSFLAREARPLLFTKTFHLYFRSLVETF